MKKEIITPNMARGGERGLRVERMEEESRDERRLRGDFGIVTVYPGYLE